jgi:hypothetical protein
LIQFQLFIFLKFELCMHTFLWIFDHIFCLLNCLNFKTESF